MTAVKIKPSHPSQGEFVLIEKTEFDPLQHELLEGENLGDSSSGSGGSPTLAELIASRDLVLVRSHQLDDLELMLGQRASELAEREQALSTREAAVATTEKPAKAAKA